jgi:hypothetical protein
MGFPRQANSLRTPRARSSVGFALLPVWLRARFRDCGVTERIAFFAVVSAGAQFGNFQMVDRSDQFMSHPQHYS